MILIILIAIVVFYLLLHGQRKNVIITSHWKEDLTWLTKATWDVVLIDHEGADPSPIKPTTVIPNRGREASSYLRYIIDNYYNLPNHVAFIHGHEDSYHQYRDENLLTLIETTPLTDDMFFNLNSDAPGYTHNKDISRDWFELWLGPMPSKNFCVAGCAQFIVSKNRITNRPVELYKAMYDHIVHPFTDHYAVGHHYELIWHYIFGEDFNMCQSKYFSPEIDYYVENGTDEYINKINNLTGGVLSIKKLTNEKGRNKYSVIIPNEYPVKKEFDEQVRKKIQKGVFEIDGIRVLVTKNFS
jgi:Protein of unknown function (DUF3431)